jgi:hypothetical protein
MTMQVVLGLIVLTDPVMRADTIFASTSASRAVMLIAAGFFAYDIVYCTRHLKDEGWEYLIHALLCGAGYTGAFVYDKLHYFGEPDTCSPSRCTRHAVHPGTSFWLLIC